MAEGALAAGTSRRDADDLCLLALSRPHEALAQALRWSITAGLTRMRPLSLVRPPGSSCVIQVTSTPGYVSCVALQLARQSGAAEREADVLGSLGTALIYAGQTAGGFAAFDRGIQLASGVLTGRVLHRRGIMLWNLGRHTAALDDFRRAVSALERADDPLWTARALSGRRGWSTWPSALQPVRMQILWPPDTCSPKPARRWKRSPDGF